MRRIELGSAGHDYIVKGLHDGNRLSTLLLSLTPRVKSVWTLVPSSGPRMPINLEDDELTGESQARETQVLRVIKNHLDTRSRNCVVFEHALAQPSDPVVSRSPVPWFGLGTEVYYYLTGPGHELAAIRNLVARAQTYRLAGFLTVAPDALSHSRPASVDERVMRELAASVSGVIMLAWHGTGKVLSEVSVDVKESPARPPARSATSN